MDIEKLNKSQIILLTLLVSFMTSIATGIVTVSLMEQAPPSITQTVNRVIERTVEKIVPGQSAAAAAVPTVQPTTKTVVVKESETLAQAIDSASASVVRVYTRPEGDSEPAFIALGVVLDSRGRIATDAEALGEAADALIDLPGGVMVRGFVTARDEATGIAYISATSTSENGVVPVWKPIEVSTSQLGLGATVVSLSGKSATRVASGLVAAISPLSKNVPDGILETSIPAASLLPGSPLINSEGVVLGLYTGVSRTIADQGFIALNRVDFSKRSVKESSSATQ